MTEKDLDEIIDSVKDDKEFNEVVSDFTAVDIEELKDSEVSK